MTFKQLRQTVRRVPFRPQFGSFSDLAILALMIGVVYA